MRIVVLAAAAAMMAGAAMAQTAPVQTGEQLFIDNCSACHQKTGLGIPGAFPALAGDKFVVGDPVLVAGTVLYGRGGMPAFKDSLPDTVLADIVTYVRASWGNKAKPIAADVFAKVRTGGPPPPPKLQAH